MTRTRWLIASLIPAAIVSAWLIATGHDDRAAGQAPIRVRVPVDEAPVDEAPGPAPIPDADDQAMLRDALLDTVVGARPGQPGSLFGDLDFAGLGRSQRTRRDRLDDFERVVGARISIDASVSREVELTMPPGHELRDRITRAWGPPPTPARWIDRDDHLIAELDDRDAQILRWDLVETVDDLIAPTIRDRFGFEPIPLLGASRATVFAVVVDDDQASADADRVRWTRPDLDEPSAKIGVVARVDATDHVIAIEVDVMAAAPDAAPAPLLIEATTRKLGPPTAAPDPAHARWTLPDRVITIAPDDMGATLIVARP